MTSEGYIDNARARGCSLHHHSCELPLTFSQIVLLRGYSITQLNSQTGPNYETHHGRTAHLYVEAGPDGTVIQFCDAVGNAPGEVGFTAPAYRSESRHIMNAAFHFSAGDYAAPVVGRNCNATMTIGDAGFELMPGDESEIQRKYGYGHYRRTRWGHQGNQAAFNSIGYTVNVHAGIQIALSHTKGHPVHGWNQNRNTTLVVPFFGSAPSSPRIVPAAEVIFSYDQFKTMLNKSGRKSESRGALYWSIDPSSGRVYVSGYYKDGTESLPGSYVRGNLWLANKSIEYFSSAIPYRPFGEGVVNRYKTATHGGFGFDIYGRPYVVLRWPWGYVRYCYVPMEHGGVPKEALPTGGQKCPDASERPPYVDSWELNFEVAPYDPVQRDIIERWYRAFQLVNGVRAIMPEVPKKDEVYRWFIAFCQNGDVTEEDELLAHTILG